MGVEGFRTLEEAEAEIARLTAERDALRAALEPFAKAARSFAPYPYNDLPCDTSFTLRQLRTARDAYEQIASEGK